MYGTISIRVSHSRNCRLPSGLAATALITTHRTTKDAVAEHARQPTNPIHATALCQLLDAVTQPSRWSGTYQLALTSTPPRTSTRRTAQIHAFTCPPVRTYWQHPFLLLLTSSQNGCYNSRVRCHSRNPSTNTQQSGCRNRVNTDVPPAHFCLDPRDIAVHLGVIPRAGLLLFLHLDGTLGHLLARLNKLPHTDALACRCTDANVSRVLIKASGSDWCAV